MTATALVSISCPDRTGLIAEVAGCLFDLGANLGDTSFAVLGTAAEFTAVCELPDGVTLQAVRSRLKGLIVLEGAEIVVKPFTLGTVHSPSGRVTHQVAVSGADRPGLIARLCETFASFGANIVRLDSERVPDARGDAYVARFAVNIPDARASACLATVSNTAEGLQLTCRVDKV
jgi:glycine cleavage system transcriptional repressor